MYKRSQGHCLHKVLYTHSMSELKTDRQLYLEKDRARRKERLAKMNSGSVAWNTMPSRAQELSKFPAASPMPTPNFAPMPATVAPPVAPPVAVPVTVPVPATVVPTVPAPLPATVAVPGAALQAAPETAPVASVLAPHVVHEVGTPKLKRVRVKKTPLSPEARQIKLERRAELSLARKEDNKQRKRRKVPETIEMTGVDLLLHAASRLGTGKQQCTVDHESSDSEEEVGKLVMDLSDDEM